MDFYFFRKIHPYSPPGDHEKMMHLENSTCLLKQRVLASKITVEAKPEKD
jgi:hypothetical protein